MFKTIKKLFDLRQDQHDYETIDQGIRSGVRIGGTNLWVLIFAILIASVGLNVNSTAVIIGAMLISPLMRPILGVGYGAAISDYRLIRTSARNLAIFAALSVVTSTLYFLASPLSQAQSELLARTTPTLWDVLIAFFGGCAGIIAQTRKGESTVIPGAAIATALMPPLCTAGYGIASQQWDFVWGAAYLFTINAFFIGWATFLFGKLMGFPEHEEADQRLQRRAHFAIILAVLVLAVPSGFLAYRLVQDQVFLAASREVLRELEQRPNAIILTKDISIPLRRVAITLGGEPLPVDVQARLSGTLRKSGFLNASLVLCHVGNEKVDLATLRDELRHDLYASTVDELEERNVKLGALSNQMAKIIDAKAQQKIIINEWLAQYPAIARISIAEASVVARSAPPATEVVLIVIEATPALLPDDIKRIEAGLGVRMPDTKIRLLQVPPAAAESERNKRDPAPKGTPRSRTVRGGA